MFGPTFYLAGAPRILYVSLPNLASLMRAPVAPHLQPDLTWPTHHDLAELQHLAINSLQDAAWEAPPSGKTLMDYESTVQS